MNRRAPLALLLALAAATLAPAARAQAPAQTFPPAPPIAPPKPFSIPASQTYRLPNGMTVTLIPWGVAPKATVYLRVRAGNLEEGRRTWLADLTAAMMKEGAGGRSSAELARAAATLGGDLGTGASYGGTAITLSVLSENAAAAVGLVGEVARRPTFPDAEFARVKDNLGRSLAQQLAQPGPVADAAFARAYWGDHPYGRTLPSPAGFAAYTLADARAFYAAQFGAKRAHLYVAGRFDAAAVKRAIAAAFGDWTPGPDRAALAATPRPGPQVILVDRPGAPQSTIRLAWPAPAPGGAGDIPMRAADSLLGGAFNSRITTNIRENKGYTYSPYSSLTFRPGVAVWSENADVTTAVTGASLREIFAEVRRLAAAPPTAEEAAGTRTYLAGLFTFENATAPQVIGTLDQVETLGLPPDWPSRYVPAVLAVAPDRFSEAVRTNFTPGAPTLVVVGDLKTVTPQLRALPELKDVPFRTVTVP